MTRRRQCLPCILVLALCTASGLPATAQTPVLVKDANTTHTGNSYQWQWPSDTRFLEMGGIAYFAASDGVHGMELWRSDGTADGTLRIGDLCPGACASFPQGLTAVGTTLYFSADDGAHGRELWKSDGTAAGTVLVADLAPGLTGSSPAGLMELNGALLYWASVSGAPESELWRSDGTAAGTAPVKGFPGSAFVTFRARLDGTLLFAARDPSHGFELWKTDGTTAGTVLVKDIRPGQEGSNISYLGLVFGGRLYFGASDGISGQELWASDGTEAGTVLVKDIVPGELPSHPTNFVEMAGQLLFSAGPGTYGELWKTDGTSAGTVLVKDIRPGFMDQGSNPLYLAVLGDWAYFAADDGTHGVELWRTDGTEANTTLVKEIRPGFYGGNPGPLAVAGDTLVFQAYDGTHGTELWKSDGTEAGTVLIADLYPGSGPGSSDDIPPFFNDMSVIGGLVYFRAPDGERDVEIYVSDGTAEGTRQLKEIDDQTSAFRVEPTGKLSGVNPMADLDGILFFQAGGGGTGTELWKSDGTAAGTELVKDIFPGHWSSLPYEITALGGRVLFNATGEFNQGQELWSSDGTEAGTFLLKDTSFYSDGGSPWWLTSAGGMACFTTDEGSLRDKLWKSDGTPEGTVEVRQDQFKPEVPRDLTAVGDSIFFSASGVYGPKLWKTDATAAGTVVVTDNYHEYPQHLTRVGHRVFFSATEGFGTGRELWVSNGTAPGTYRLKDIGPEDSSGIAALHSDDPGFRLDRWASARNKLFFLADDGTTGEELWVSDGTAAGTEILADAFPGTRSSEIREVITAGERVYFVADDGTHGREMWVSDGTPAGTRLLADLAPGEASSLPEQLQAVGLNLVFSAWTPEHGREPWLVGGRFAPRRLADIAPGPLPSSPLAFTLSGASLYFAATDAETGFELYSVPRAEVDGSTDFYTVTPCRLVDTRTAGGALEGGVPRTFPVTDLCGIPAGAVALSVNLTVVSPAAGGNLVVYANGELTPPTSSLNFSAGLNRAGNAIVATGPEGLEALARTAGQVHLLVDVTGYFK